MMMAPTPTANTAAQHSTAQHAQHSSAQLGSCGAAQRSAGSAGQCGCKGSWELRVEGWVAVAGTHLPGAMPFPSRLCMRLGTAPSCLPTCDAGSAVATVSATAAAPAAAATSNGAGARLCSWRVQAVWRCCRLTRHLRQWKCEEVAAPGTRVGQPRAPKSESGRGRHPPAS